MSRESMKGGYTPARATRFYVPLFVQAFSQSLTYPLVAAIVSHGPLGSDTLTAFAQGQTVMFLIGAIGGGLVTTGMVFARTRAGYRSFIHLNAMMMAVLLSMQAIAAMPPLGPAIFVKLLGLPPELADIACETLLWGIPLQSAFFLRNVPLVILFNERASAAANNATIIRIALTLLASWLFVRIGWTGSRWGLVAMTVPCFTEFALTHLFARRHVRALRDDEPSEPVSVQFRFAMPLALGGFLLAAAPLMIAEFVRWTADSVAMLTVHFVTVGVANAIGYGALRMQPVSIQFPPEYEGDRRMLRYAVVAGLVLGTMQLVFVHPDIAGWYFLDVQNIPLANLGKARIAIALYVLLPVLQSVRGYMEGFAAVRKKSSAILAGQVAYLLVLVAALAVMLAAGVPGWLMGVISILAATASTTVAICSWLSRMPSR